MDDMIRGPTHAVVGEHNTKRILSHISTNAATGQVEFFVHIAKGFSPPRADVGIVARTVRIVISPIVMPGGVALGENDHGEVGIRLHVVVSHLTQRREDKFRLSIDSKKQILR